jgi:Glycosyl hydrolase family 92/SCO1/SenC
MTMAYKLKDSKEVQNLKSGDEITADVLVHSDSDDYLLDSVTITNEARRGLLPAMLPPHQLIVAETVPDLPLVNEDGKTIHLNDYRGKALLVTFIYTRCPNVYVQSVELNGVPLTRSWFTHADIVAGGELRFHMGPEPNRAWGSARAVRPPSVLVRAGR